jgi:hypothetical protein
VASGPDRVAAGTWGGPHVVLEVSAEGGRVEYDCAHGALGAAGPLLKCL